MKSLFVITLILCLIACVMASDASRSVRQDSSFSKCIAECKTSVPDANARLCGHLCRPAGKFNTMPVLPKHRHGNKNATESVSALADSEQGDKVDPGKLWDQYRSTLFTFLRKGDANAMPNLQLVTQPIQAEWDQNPDQLTELANRLTRPGVTHEWSGKYFSDQYRDFLYNIAAPADQSNPGLDARIADWDAKLGEAEMGIMMAEMTCATNYQKWVDQFRDAAPSFDKFKQSYCGYQLKRAYDKYDLILADAERDTAAQYGQFYDAKRALAKFVKTTNKDFKALGALASFTQSSQAGTTNKFNVKITSKTSVTREKESSWSVGISASFPVFGVPVEIGGSFSQGKLNMNSRSDEFQLEVGAGGITYIPVLPNQNWFTNEVLSKYQSGPFVTPKNYFTDDGMKYLLRGMFVISRPKIVLYVGSEDASAMKKTSEMGLKVSVMGIGVDFKKNSRLSVNQAGANVYEVRIDGDDPVPQILAMDYMKLPL